MMRATLVSLAAVAIVTNGAINAVQAGDITDLQHQLRTVKHQEATTEAQLSTADGRVAHAGQRSVRCPRGSAFLAAGEVRHAT